jgi:diguanylate cyclase (GGDEF)-like protein
MEASTGSDEIRRLREQNATLRALLESLGRDAAHNQAVLQRFQERELALLGATDLVELLERMTRGMRRSFGLDSLKLKLLDPYNVIRDLLDAQSETLGGMLGDVELCPDVNTTRARFDDLREPWLGRWCGQRHESLFGWRLGGSVALLPLQHTEGLAGYLCLGSRDPHRFESGQATDFLAHLASTAAVCLENAVNRERLRLAGLTDSLTGLYNRRHLQHRLAQEVTRAQRYGQALSCLFVDADHFKRINDHHGHAAGDQVLVALAQRLRARLRASDLPTRYGGEEFAVLLPETDLSNALLLAEQIRAAVASTEVTVASAGTIRVTVSIGVAELDPGEQQRDAGEAMLRTADRAVYQAKADGRNCVRTIERRKL